MSTTTTTRTQSLISRLYDDKGNFMPAVLAELLAESTPIVSDWKSMVSYIYRDGMYHDDALQFCSNAAKSILKDKYRDYNGKDVLGCLFPVTHVKEIKEATPNFIHVKNGTYDINTDTLLEHSPERFFFNMLDVKYDPEAECPKIDKFMSEIVTPEEVQLVYEVIGYCMYRDYKFAKSVMLLGDGANGKSTLLFLIKAFLGEHNVVGKSLIQLEEDRFAASDLFHKLANIHADIPNRSLTTTGRFKMLTGKDVMDVERKFGQPFRFVNYAKFLFSANEMPSTNDKTNAFFRRWIIVRFSHVFEGASADVNLLDKLTTEEELSGLLNRAIAGLKRLLENGWSIDSSTDDIRRDYTLLSSTVAAFAQECLVAEPTSHILKSEAYEVYVKYCTGNIRQPVTSIAFFRALPRNATVQNYRPTVNGTQVHAYKGVKYNAFGEFLLRQSNVSPEAESEDSV